MATLASTLKPYRLGLHKLADFTKDVHKDLQGAEATSQQAYTTYQKLIGFINSLPTRADVAGFVGTPGNIGTAGEQIIKNAQSKYTEQLMSEQNLKKLEVDQALTAAGKKVNETFWKNVDAVKSEATSWVAYIRDPQSPAAKEPRLPAVEQTLRKLNTTLNNVFFELQRTTTNTISSLKSEGSQYTAEGDPLDLMAENLGADAVFITGKTSDDTELERLNNELIALEGNTNPDQVAIENKIAEIDEREKVVKATAAGENMNPLTYALMTRLLPEEMREELNTKYTEGKYRAAPRELLQKGGEYLSDKVITRFEQLKTDLGKKATGSGGKPTTIGRVIRWSKDRRMDIQNITDFIGLPFAGISRRFNNIVATARLAVENTGVVRAIKGANETLKVIGNVVNKAGVGVLAGAGVAAAIAGIGPGLVPALIAGAAIGGASTAVVGSALEFAQLSRRGFKGSLLTKIVGRVAGFKAQARMRVWQMNNQRFDFWNKDHTNLDRGRVMNRINGVWVDQANAAGGMEKVQTKGNGFYILTEGVTAERAQIKFVDFDGYLEHVRDGSHKSIIGNLTVGVVDSVTERFGEDSRISKLTKGLFSALSPARAFSPLSTFFKGGMRAFALAGIAAPVSVLFGLGAAPGLAAAAVIGIGTQVITDGISNGILHETFQGKLLGLLSTMPFYETLDMYHSRAWIADQTRLFLGNTKFANGNRIMPLNEMQKTLYSWGSIQGVFINGLNLYTYLNSGNVVSAWIFTKMAPSLPGLSIDALPAAPASGFGRFISRLTGLGVDIGKGSELAGKSLTSVTGPMFVGGIIGTVAGVLIASYFGLPIGLGFGIGAAIGSAAGFAVGTAIAGSSTVASWGVGAAAAPFIITGSTALFTAAFSTAGAWIEKLLSGLVSQFNPLAFLNVGMAIYNVYRLITAPIRDLSDYAKIVTIAIALIGALSMLASLDESQNFNSDRKSLANTNNTSFMISADKFAFADDFKTMNIETGKNNQILVLNAKDANLNAENNTLSFTGDNYHWELKGEGLKVEDGKLDDNMLVVASNLKAKIYTNEATKSGVAGVSSEGESFCNLYQKLCPKTYSGSPSE
jgi:hypothetical protein